MSKFCDEIGETYRVIRGYLPSEEAIQYGKDLISHVDNRGTPTAANIVGDAYDEYNYPEHVAILSEKVAELNGILGEKVLPTYCFSRVYKDGGYLERHTDRESCEVSLSIHLWGDEEWTFWIKNLAGEEVGVVLQPGDAILYDGPTAEHWRDVYKGKNYAQLFTHYVYLNGEYKNNYFDNVDHNLSLMSGVETYRGFVPAELCDKIVEQSTSPDLVENWTTQDTVGGEAGHRVCEGFSLINLPELDHALWEQVTAALQRYTSSRPHLIIQEDCGYTILRYSSGGKYDQHTDHHKEYNRILTVIVNLNDDYTGGELHHFSGKLKTQLGKGDIVIFPSSFQYPHAITPIIDGTRFSVVSWVV